MSKWVLGTWHQRHQRSLISEVFQLNDCSWSGWGDIYSLGQMFWATSFANPSCCLYAWFQHVGFVLVTGTDSSRILVFRPHRDVSFTELDRLDKQGRLWPKTPNFEMCKPIQTIISSKMCNHLQSMSPWGQLGSVPSPYGLMISPAYTIQYMDKGLSASMRWETQFISSFFGLKIPHSIHWLVINFCLFRRIASDTPMFIKLVFQCQLYSQS